MSVPARADLKRGLAYASTIPLYNKPPFPTFLTSFSLVTIQVAQCLGSASGLSNLLLGSFCYIELPLMPPVETNYTF